MTFSTKLFKEKIEYFYQPLLKYLDLVDKIVIKVTIKRRMLVMVDFLKKSLYLIDKLYNSKAVLFNFHLYTQSDCN